MDRTAAVMYTALIGAMVSAQAPVNAQVAKAVGAMPAVLVAYVIGIVVLVGLTAVTGTLTDLGKLGDAPTYAVVCGGLIGVAYVVSVTVTVKTLGAGGVAAAVIAGQLAMSVTIDHFGWFGVTKSPVEAAKVIGVVLLGLGTYLIVKD